MKIWILGLTILISFLASGCSEEARLVQKYGEDLNPSRSNLGIEIVDSSWTPKVDIKQKMIIWETLRETPDMVSRTSCYDAKGLYLDEDFYSSGALVSSEATIEDNPVEEYLRVYYYYATTNSGLALKCIKAQTNVFGKDEMISISDATSVIASWGLDAPKVLVDYPDEPDEE